MGVEVMKLERIRWTDATCVAAWHSREEVEEFATSQIWNCSNIGWNVYEDDDCVVLAARISDKAEHMGLLERLPKRMIKHRELLIEEEFDA